MEIRRSKRWEFSRTLVGRGRCTLCDSQVLRSVLASVRGLVVARPVLLPGGARRCFPLSRSPRSVGRASEARLEEPASCVPAIPNSPNKRGLVRRRLGIRRRCLSVDYTHESGPE